MRTVTLANRLHLCTNCGCGAAVFPREFRSLLTKSQHLASNFYGYWWMRTHTHTKPRLRNSINVWCARKTKLCFDLAPRVHGLYVHVQPPWSHVFQRLRERLVVARTGSWCSLIYFTAMRDFSQLAVTKNASILHETRSKKNDAFCATMCCAALCMCACLSNSGRAKFISFLQFSFCLPFLWSVNSSILLRKWTAVQLSLSGTRIGCKRLVGVAGFLQLYKSMWCILSKGAWSVCMWRSLDLGGLFNLFVHPNCTVIRFRSTQETQRIRSDTLPTL